MYKNYYHSRLLLVIVATLLSAACTPKQPAVISLAAPQSLMSSLVWISQELGYFKQQQIELEIQAYPSGKRALAAMLDGKSSLAISAETPFVINSFTRGDLRLYATLGQSDNDVRVLARRDHGIQKISDLKGKTIGTQKGSAVHFFLSSFMLFHRLDANSINIRFFKAEQLVPALASGEIDAISMREPILSEAVKAVGSDKLVEFSNPGLYTKTYNLVGFNGFTTVHPSLMSRILTALHQGAEFVKEHPQLAIDMIVKRIQLPRQDIVENWSNLRLSVTLNQGLLTSLQEQAHWVVESNLVEHSQPGHIQQPDIWSLLNPGPLSNAIPDAVGLIGVSR